MTDLTLSQVVLLLIWGTLTAVDLVSVPQAMISRPLVAGTVAGCLAGDLEAGLRAAAHVFEHFLDFVLIGALSGGIYAALRWWALQ